MNSLNPKPFTLIRFCVIIIALLKEVTTIEEQLQIKVRKGRTHCRVQVSGELDSYTRPLFRRVVDGIIGETSISKVSFHLEGGRDNKDGLTFIDHRGVEIMYWALKAMRAKHGNVAEIHVHHKLPMILRIFARLSLLAEFGIHDCTPNQNAEAA